ncbi:hypothetical protein H4R35_002041 [Dimargaris xerosporica]|nr:hypothetical protein H4R35_002041 [Dimargaris xerosporica]
MLASRAPTNPPTMLNTLPSYPALTAASHGAATYHSAASRFAYYPPTAPSAGYHGATLSGQPGAYVASSSAASPSTYYGRSGHRRAATVTVSSSAFMAASRYTAPHAPTHPSVVTYPQLSYGGHTYAPPEHQYSTASHHFRY